MKKIILLALLLVLLPLFVVAQGVTTSSITGKVVDQLGEPLIGATVIATHVPTGTTYRTSTQANGNFTFATVRVGGPYSLRVTYIGFESWEQTGIRLELGKTLKVQVTLSEDAVLLEGIEVMGSSSSSGATSGANTQVSTEQL